MISAFDEQMLRRALRVAMNGRGRVEPNPMVGCVLTKNNQIIAEGWHTHFGGPHAEPTALADCQTRGHDPRGATAYVTLEPCCHTNKKTPPCAPRLIEAGIARVVIGCLDPNPDVDGKGVEMLRYAGIEVEAASPELAAEFLQLIAPFRTYAARSYVTVKWAESVNGKVAGENGKPVRITGQAATRAVHRLRANSHAIAVGVNTVISDDPLLNVRDVPVTRQPTRLILDRHLRTPVESRLLQSREPGGHVQIVCSVDAPKRYPDRYDALWRAHADIIDQLDPADPTGQSLLTTAAHCDMHSHLMIEAGPSLAMSILPWADRLWVFVSPNRLPNGPSVPRAATIPATYVETGRLTLGADTLIEYLNGDAASFVTATPSADFVLEAERAASL